MKLPIRRDPHHDDVVQTEDIERLTSAFSRQLERWPDFFQPFEDLMRRTLAVADVEETEDTYLIDVELPGVKPEDISVEVTDDHLTVDAQRRERQRVGLLRQHTRRTGRFHYEVTLPSGIDADAVTATLDDGVLHVLLPKVESARRRKVAVTTGAGSRALSA